MDKDQKYTSGESNPAFDDGSGGTSGTRLSNADIGRFLDSAQRSMDRMDLRQGFFTDPSDDVARHHLANDDLTAHHRMSDFPHVRHQMGLQKPKSSHKDSKKRKHHHHHPHHKRSASPEHDEENDQHWDKEEPHSSKEAEELPGGEDERREDREDNEQNRSSLSFLDNVTGDHPSPDHAAPREDDAAPVKIHLELFDNTETADDQVYTPRSYNSDSMPNLTSDASDDVDGSDGQNTTGSTVVLADKESDADKIVPNKLSFLEQIGLDNSRSPMFSMSAASITPEIPEPTTNSVSNNSKVTFSLGCEDEEDVSDEKEDDVKPLRTDSKDGIKSSPEPKRHHKHKHHHMRIPSEKELAKRRHRGSEVTLVNELKVTEMNKEGVDDTMSLEEDEMARHRYEGVHAVSRRRISTQHSTVPSVIHVGKKKKVKKKFFEKKPTFDHSPHDLFVELAELNVGENEEMVWEGKARWIKFEEDVEEGLDRWGKPHVASLSFHSLLELRRCLEKGVVLLDLDSSDLPSIANHIVDKLVIGDILSSEDRGLVLKALLLKHKRKGAAIPNNSSSTSLKSFFNRRASRADKHVEGEKENHVHFDVENQTDPPVTFTPPSTPTNRRASMAPTHNILHRIPEGAEATSVLVGPVDLMKSSAMAFVRLAEGHVMENLTEVPLPTRFLFVLLGPKDSSLDYHEIGRSISTLMANKTFHNIAYQADSRQDLLDAINDYLDDSIVLPPGNWDKKTLLPVMEMARKKALRKEQSKKKEIKDVEEDKFGDPLKRTGRFFGGLINDAKRRYPKYLSDFRDGLNMQCLATFFFIYFAALSPAITFGGLLGEKTEKWMGVSEMLVACSSCGIIFSLTAAQPLIIVGATGPMLVFEEGLFQICDSFGIEFMALRFWAGIWLVIVIAIVVCFEGSFLVSYFTRFTQEIFASLISLIFIIEVFIKLSKIYKNHPLSLHECLEENETRNAFSDFVTDVLTSPSSLSNITDGDVSEPEDDKPKNQPNTALLSTILCLGTFCIAYLLKIFRNSKFLGRSARRALGDFGIPIAIFIMVLVDVLITPTYTEALDVPDGFVPTASEKRGWLIHPMGEEETIPIWAIFFALIPALLLFILLFMETQITSTIVNKKEHKLKKGSGYHLDLMIIGSFAILSGTLGLPFLCAATVRSVTHTSALTVYSRDHAPGDKPKLEKVHEQRITAFAVHIMMGVSVLMGPLLRRVPLAVLFGVFLYMGIASMSGIQLFERTALLFTPTKHHPNTGFVRRVKTKKMHIYTLIQLFCLAVLWAVKSTAAALAFPFVLIMTVPLRRHILKFIFTQEELHELDNDEVDEGILEDNEDEPDFYTTAHMPW